MNTINNITGKYDPTFLTETREGQRAEKPKENLEESKTDMPPNDKVSLSNASRDYIIAEDAVRKADGVRQEKVDQIKDAVANGQYTVDAEKVAEKMIGTIISDRV